ncbi:MAG TPA: glycoside hydrolase family 13 protein [Trueperaceae bacterium]
MTPTVPDWVKDAVFYQVFPDRFARSERSPKPANVQPWGAPTDLHGYQGGDLLGVAERLGHLEALGVNAIYLNPVFSATAYHRYHTHDYHRVDPLLGGDAALAALLSAAHERGMRVILDGVFNHASRGFLPFSDVLENGPKSPYVDWFHVRRFPLNAYGGGELGYEAWWGLPALPKLNVANPMVREFIFDVGERWLRFGADGWRLDVPSEIDDDEFWREFRRRCTAAKPDAYIVGEVWDLAERWLQGDMFHGVMNYPFARAVYGLVGRDLDRAEAAKSGLGRIEPLEPSAFAARMEELLKVYPGETAFGQLNLLGSHDTPRLATLLCGDEAAVRQALLLLFAAPGAPCVYYGDEIGLRGGHDPHNRAAMPWDDRGAWDEGLLAFVGALGRLRRELHPLRRGGARVFAQSGAVVVRRESEAGVVCAAVNATDHDVELTGDALPADRCVDRLDPGRGVSAAAFVLRRRGLALLTPA